MLERGEPVGDLFTQLRRIGFAVSVKIGADLRRNREPGWNRQAQIAHLGETCTLSAEQVLHVCTTLGGPVAKPVDPFRHPPLILRFVKNQRPGSESPGYATTIAADWP